MSLQQEKTVVCLYESCSTLQLKKLYKLQALSAALGFRNAERSFIEKYMMSPNVIFVAPATLLILQKNLN
jgi:hypothetical protein